MGETPVMPASHGWAHPSPTRRISNRLKGSVMGTRAVVAGKVQGVGFRAGCRRRARQLGLAGWVRNLSDGRVEVVAVGDPARVDELLRWAEQGPPAATVHSIEIDRIRVTASTTFELRV